MIHLKYLVVGTGRCGTVTAAKMLTKAGVPCGHESIFDYVGLDVAVARLRGNAKISLSYCSTHYNKDHAWKELPPWIDVSQGVQAESSYMAVPFLDDPLVAMAKLIHVVRNPLDVIPSFCDQLMYFNEAAPREKCEYEKFIYKYAPQVWEGRTRYERATLYYILWTDKIKRQTTKFYKIENQLEDLFRDLGLAYPGRIDKEQQNSVRPRTMLPFTVDMIQDKKLRERLVATCEYYGYQPSSSKAMFL